MHLCFTVYFLALCPPFHICAVADLLRTYANIDQLPDIARQSIYIILNHLAQCNVWSQSLENFFMLHYFFLKIMSCKLSFHGDVYQTFGLIFFRAFGNSVCDWDWDSGWQTAIGLNSLDDQCPHIPRLCNTSHWLIIWIRFTGRSSKLNSLDDH